MRGDANPAMAALAEVPRDQWIAALHGPPAVRDAAHADLHALLLRAARFELGRRRTMLRDASSAEMEDLAVQAADDAMVALLGKLDTFRGASRFTTWAYKFALLEPAVKARRRAWRDREIPLDEAVTDRGPPAQQVLEDAETLRAGRAAMDTALTPHQRQVFVALALNGVPIDVLAERLDTTRGALYKTLHDARRTMVRSHSPSRPSSSGSTSSPRC